jgi:hypothetical protein
MAFAATLTMRRSYRKLATTTLVGAVVGVLYFIFLWRLLGNPFANFRGHRADWGSGTWPLTYPFGALVPTYISAFHEMRWTSFTYRLLWAVATSAGLAVTFLPSSRQRLCSIRPKPGLPGRAFASASCTMFITLPLHSTGTFCRACRYCYLPFAIGFRVTSACFGQVQDSRRYWRPRAQWALEKSLALT